MRGTDVAYGGRGGGGGGRVLLWGVFWRRGRERGRRARRAGRGAGAAKEGGGGAGTKAGAVVPAGGVGTGGLQHKVRGSGDPRNDVRCGPCNRRHSTLLPAADRSDREAEAGCEQDGGGGEGEREGRREGCLLYTSDAADDM
eukprot:1687611-Rhodomonas_salina.1